jgi:hypothetical protein
MSMVNTYLVVHLVAWPFAVLIELYRGGRDYILEERIRE